VGESEQDEHSGANRHPNTKVQGQQTAQGNLNPRDIGKGVSECSSRVPSSNKQEYQSMLDSNESRDVVDGEHEESMAKQTTMCKNI
jgi:hypothetical protein